MKILTFKTILILFLITVFLSCSQKYDEVGFGIVDPGLEPISDTVTVKQIAEFMTNVEPKHIVNDDYLWLGNVTEGLDTLITADVYFDFSLSASDTLVDSCKVLFPVYSEDIEDFENILVNVSKVKEEWNETVEDSLVDIETEFQNIGNITETDESFNFDYFLNVPVDKDSLAVWAKLGSDDNYFHGLKMEIEAGMPELIKLYSSEWDSYDYRPKVLRYTTGSDTSGASIVLTDTSAVSMDVNYLTRKAEILEDTTKFKVGNISGEGATFRFNLDSLHSKYPNLSDYGTLITAKLYMFKSSEDSIYGGIEKPVFFEMSDSAWVYNPEEFNYDTLNYWYETNTELVYEDTAFISLYTPVLRWIRDPEKNNGFYIRSFKEKEFNNDDELKSFGYTVYENLKLELHFVVPQISIEED